MWRTEHIKTLRLSGILVGASFALALLSLPVHATYGTAPAGGLLSHNPKVAGLVFDARSALRADDIMRALTDLKFAVGMEPTNPYVLTELGIAFNRGGFCECRRYASPRTQFGGPRLRDCRRCRLSLPPRRAA